MFINYDIKRYLRSIVMILKGFSSNNLKNSDSSIFDVVNVRQCLFIIITFGIWSLANLSCASRISIMITHSPHSLFLSLSLTHVLTHTHTFLSRLLSIYLCISLSLTHTHTTQVLDTLRACFYLPLSQFTATTQPMVCACCVPRQVVHRYIYVFVNSCFHCKLFGHHDRQLDVDVIPSPIFSDRPWSSVVIGYECFNWTKW